MRAATVADLADLVRRCKAALAEGGRPDLAALCVALVDEEGKVHLAFHEVVRPGPGRPHAAEVVKAISMDPQFEWGREDELS